MKVLVTGGSGFIGSNLVRHLLSGGQHSVVNVDAMTYAANPTSLADVENDERYCFCDCDIVDAAALEAVFEEHQPNAVIHLAAESHVDRSIDSPSAFIQTNVVGTFNLLNCALQSFESLEESLRHTFRFIHVSTDEVFGSLKVDDPATLESDRYAPSSPYSASKAGSDHLALAWHVTYGLPVIVTHAANNYGPYQYPEKLIPTVISRAVNRQSIPVYGDGTNVRDWLHVEDHCLAICRVLENGSVGESYNVGADNELKNIDLVREVCRVIDELTQNDCGDGFRHEELIEFVTDRKGHDFRYALNTEKIRRHLDWSPQMNWSDAIRETVKWYLDHRSWWQHAAGAGTDRHEG
jgi:dTDP-glucose 4,6-dehydratase